MKSILFISLILSSFFASAQSTTELLRFDGLYQTEPEVDPETSDTTTNFIRFYPDGKVITVGSTGKAYDLKGWFNLRHDDISQGEYKITNRKIEFSSTSSYGTVTYEGEINRDQTLILNVKSMINDYHGLEKYFFIRVTGLK
ncbi:MAG: hypothetical protein HOP08_02500 [Cyclobacteriaceae bacterium]|nr:hypothetical protein [Cyclobacteriaceae bacterium]